MTHAELLQQADRLVRQLVPFGPDVGDGYEEHWQWNSLDYWCDRT